MGLFKKFNIGKASKSELESFKSHLKYGDDPMEHWKKSREGFDIWHTEKKATEQLLRKILQPEESDKRHNWSSMEINIWSHKGKCKESPIGEHVYLHQYGEKNPKRGEQICLCCGRDLDI